MFRIHSPIRKPRTHEIVLPNSPSRLPILAPPPLPSGSQKKQVKGFEDQGPLRAYACVLRARGQDARNPPPIATRLSDWM
jgi:hypothetical protein